MGEVTACALARLLLADRLPQRWRHVQAVAAAAGRYADALGLDSDVVVAAAWLHDIGYAPEVVDTGFHPLDGGRYLRRRGWPDRVCSLVAHHTDAAGQSEAYGLREALAAEFEDVAGLERDVLWRADATTGPAGQDLSLDQRVAEVAVRYGSDHVVAVGMHISRAKLAAAIDRVSAATRVSADG